jgi:thymidine phosphorylase
MDVNCGQGAFMKTPAEARALAESLVTTGNRNRVRTQALLTAMDAPLGRAVGNGLEVAECIATMQGRGPKDLEKLCVILAARMVLLGGLAASREDAEQKAQQALDAGHALNKFRQLVAQQGGEPRVVDDPWILPSAQQVLLRAERSGYIYEVNAEQVGLAAMLLGAGRDRANDTVDPAVGIVLQTQRGEQVRANDVLAEVHYRQEDRLGEAMVLLRQAWRIEDGPPPALQLVLDEIS